MPVTKPPAPIRNGRHVVPFKLGLESTKASFEPSLSGDAGVPLVGGVCVSGADGGKDRPRTDEGKAGPRVEAGRDAPPDESAC
jgi:hypothetical protein